MLRKVSLGLLVASALAVAFQVELGGSRQAHANHGGRRVSVQGDLFYNYYVAPTYPTGVPAQMYLSPRPVPPHVGWTWYTYQPLYPHEYLYVHNRNYWAYNPGGGLTRTRVRWGHNPLNQLNPITGRGFPRPVEWDYPAAPFTHD